MRWYEYKMEVDDLHASDDLKAKLLALQANAAETPGAKSIAMPALSPTPKKQKKPLRFPARRWAQLAACVAVCGVCLYGAVYAYEWKGVTLLGGGSSSNYSAAATKAAAPQAAVYSMEDTENAADDSADNGVSTFSAEDSYRSAETAAGGSLLTSGEAESDASARTADSARSSILPTSRWRPGITIPPARHWMRPFLTRTAIWNPAASTPTPTAPGASA